MTENENYEIADLISKISPYIRFVGVISKSGQLLANHRREDLVPLLDQKGTQYQFAQIAIKTELEEQFDDQLGDTEFIWEERTKVQTFLSIRWTIVTTSSARMNKKRRKG